MSTRVVDRPEASRYELIQDGQVLGYADYRRGDDAVELPHTVVDPAHRGQGLAAELVGAALDDLRSQGARVIPTCWYVAEFIDTHPDYQDLLV